MPHSTSRIEHEHDELAVRLGEVAEMLMGTSAHERKVAFCEESMHVLRRHMQGEEAFMSDVGYPAEAAALHAAHHQEIFDVLSEELWKIIDGVEDGRHAIEIAYELLRVHRERHDKDLAKFVLLRKYGAKRP